MTEAISILLQEIKSRRQPCMVLGAGGLAVATRYTPLTGSLTERLQKTLGKATGFLRDILHATLLNPLRHWLNASSQYGSSIPVAALRDAPESRELSGRLAGGGYSFVPIGDADTEWFRNCRVLAKMDSAKPNQLVSP